MSHVPLEKILSSLESGSRPPGGVTSESGEIPSLGAEHLTDEGSFNFSSIKRIPRIFFESMGTGRINYRDILIVKDGATTGKTSFINDNFPFQEAAINEHVFCLRVDQSMASPEYVFHFLRSPIGQKEIALDFRGATVGGISRGFVKIVHLPVPSLSEQKRIAEILDKADALRAKRRANLALLDTLTQSIFLDMFGDPVLNTKSWPRRTINDIATVVTGNTPPRVNPQYYGDEIEWIKSDNINTPNYYLTRAEEGLSKLGCQIGRVVPAGSILVTCIAGSPECIGNSAMTDRDVAFNQQINALIPIEGNAHFIYNQLRIGKKLIQQASTKGMKGIVSKSRFERIEVIWPPDTIQERFAKRVITIQEEISKQRNSLRMLNELFTSLQNRAFNGEL